MRITNPSGGASANPPFQFTGHIDGQTVFVLPFTPANPLTVEMEIDGKVERFPSISVSGNAVTWSGGYPVTAADMIYFNH